MWKESLPQNLTMYLLAQIRAASKASDESCSFSSETKCTQAGNHPHEPSYVLGHKSGSWDQVHHGRSETWGRVYFCSNGSIELDAFPCFPQI